MPTRRPALLLACGLFTACQAPETPQLGRPEAQDSGGAEPVLVEDCAIQPDAFADLRVDRTSVPTVLRVRWTSPKLSAGSIYFSGPDGRVLVSPQGDTGTSHDILVVGLGPDTDSELVALSQSGTERRCSAPVPIRTASLPVGFPQIAVETLQGDVLSGGYVLTSVISQHHNWITVLDDHGQVVWVWQKRLPNNLPASPATRVRLSPDGRGLLFNLQAERSDGAGALVFVPWDGGEHRSTAVVGAHTDFSLLPDGRALSLGWEIREFAGRRLLGDTVERVEADGSQTRLWSAFDHFDPDLAFSYPKGFLPQEPEVEDWSHVNGISYDEDSDGILVTIPAVNGVASIDAASGEQRWAVAGRGGDFELVDGPQLINLPHSAEATPTGLLVFNRNDWIGGTSCSEAVDIDLDLNTLQAVEASHYAGPDCQKVGFLGNASRLDDGSTLVAWSSAGLVDVANPDGQLAWRVRVDFGAAVGFATYAPSLGAGGFAPN
jgi:hypothetical protein